MGSSLREKSVPSRPSDIDKYLKLDAEIKAMEKQKEALKPSIREYLLNGDYDDIRLIEVNTEKIDAEKAMSWSKENMTMEDFKALFISVFDVNAFSELIKTGKVSKKSMVKQGILSKVTRKDIRCFHPKESK